MTENYKVEWRLCCYGENCGCRVWIRKILLVCLNSLPLVSLVVMNVCLLPVSVVISQTTIKTIHETTTTTTEKTRIELRLQGLVVIEVKLCSHRWNDLFCQSQQRQTSENDNESTNRNKSWVDFKLVVVVHGSWKQRRIICAFMFDGITCWKNIGFSEKRVWTQRRKCRKQENQDAENKLLLLTSFIPYSFELHYTLFAPFSDLSLPGCCYRVISFLQIRMQWRIPLNQMV